MSHIITLGGKIITKGGRQLIQPTIADNVIRDGSTVAWYDSSDLTTITKDGSDFVSRWNDKLGSGRDLLQASAVSQPKWVNVDGVLFDGVNDGLYTSNADQKVPIFIYIVVKVKSSKIGWIFGTAGYSLGVPQFNIVTSTELGVFAGAYINPYIPFAIDTYYIYRVLFNGTYSFIKQNNSLSTFGNTGLSNFTNFSLAYYKAGFSSFTNIQVKEVILRNVADSAADEIAIYNYLATKYGFTPIYVDPVKVGDLYGGGIVAYILQSGDPGYEAGKTKGLIAGANLGGKRWNNGTNITIGTSNLIGTGLSNTNAIIAAQGATETDYAAGLAKAYTGGGYTDWYLPSLNELKAAITSGVMRTNSVYTSTEAPYSSPLAYAYYDTGGVFYISKNASLFVFPFRFFTIG